MMSGLLRTGSVLILGAMLAGCSPKAAEMVLDTQRVPPAEVMKRVSANAAGITTLTGSGSVSFEGPETAGSVFFTLALKKPDSLLIRFEGPFGLDAGFLFLSRSQYVMFNRLENQVIMGSPSDAGIRWALPVDLTVDEILDAFTGSFRFPAGEKPSGFTTDEDQFLLSYERNPVTESYWVDPATALVTRYRREGDDRTVFAQTSQPEEQDGLHMPREISLAFPQQGRQLSVYYNALTFNPGSVSFRYTIPRSAQVRSPKP